MTKSFSRKKSTARATFSGVPSRRTSVDRIAPARSGSGVSDGKSTGPGRMQFTRTHGLRVPSSTARQLVKARGQTGTPARPGDRVPKGRTPRFLAQIDFDGAAEGRGGEPSRAVQLPGQGETPEAFFPTFPHGYGNGSLAERLEHPLLFNPFQPQGDDRVFAVSNLEALLRYGDTGPPALTPIPSPIPSSRFIAQNSRSSPSSHPLPGREGISDKGKPHGRPWR